MRPSAAAQSTWLEAERSRAAAAVVARYGPTLEELREFREAVRADAYAFTIRLCYAYRLTAGWRLLTAPYLSATDARFRDSLWAWGRVVSEGAWSVYDSRLRLRRELQGKGWRDPETWAGSLFLAELGEAPGFAAAALNCLGEPAPAHASVGERARAMNEAMSRANAFIGALGRADVIGMSAHHATAGAALLAGAGAVLTAADAAIGSVVAAGFRFLAARVPDRVRASAVVERMRGFWRSLGPRGQVAAAGGAGALATVAPAWMAYEDAQADRRAVDAASGAAAASMPGAPSDEVALIADLHDAYETGAEWQRLRQRGAAVELSSDERAREAATRARFFEKLDGLVLRLDRIRSAEAAARQRSARSHALEDAIALETFEFMIPLLEARRAEIER